MTATPPTSGRLKLHDADLTWAKLQGADLSRAKLHGAGLSGAELVGADLGYAGLEGADLTGALIPATVGEPLTDGETDLFDVRWKTSDLPVGPGCRKDIITCHLGFRGIPDDLRVAWWPNAHLKDHLLKHEDGEQERPVWIPNR